MREKKLRCTRHVAGSDEDCEIVADVEVGYDIFDNFVVHYSTSRYYYGSGGSDHVYATVDRADVPLLLKYLDTTRKRLPRAFASSYWGVNDAFASTHDIRGVFQSALDFILESGAHYQLEQ